VAGTTASADARASLSFASGHVHWLRDEESSGEEYSMSVQDLAEDAEDVIEYAESRVGGESILAAEHVCAADSIAAVPVCSSSRAARGT
jgi:hypothetical protein